jgi:tetratricopeptide (TPR) repeat protein
MLFYRLDANEGESMRATKIATIAVLALLGAGCPNKERNESIEAMNKGIDNFNKGSSALAVQEFKHATESYRENHQAWYNLGQVYAKDKKWKDAKEAFTEAAKYKKDDAMYQMWLGISRYQDGDLEVAQTSLDEAVRLNPDLYRAYWYLGLTHRDSDRPKEAAQAWTQAAQLNPLFGPPFSQLGLLYLQWDQVDAALKVLQQAALNVKDDRDLTDVYYYLGLAYDAQKNYDKAIEAYSKAVELRGDNLDAKFQRGLAYAAKGDKANAKKDLEEYNKGGQNSFNKTQANKVLMQLLAAEGITPPANPLPPR